MSAMGYRVAYTVIRSSGQGASHKMWRELQHGPNMPTKALAERSLKVHKRRGLTAWIETKDGDFVPVKGAMKKPGLGGVRRNGAYRERIPGGIASGRSPRDFDAAQLRRGTRVELEHTAIRGRRPTKRQMAMAQEIAMDHLAEHPDYYKALAKMESGLSRRGRNLAVHSTIRYEVDADSVHKAMRAFVELKKKRCLTRRDVDVLAGLLEWSAGVMHGAGVADSIKRRAAELHIAIKNHMAATGCADQTERNPPKKKGKKMAKKTKKKSSKKKSKKKTTKRGPFGMPYASYGGFVGPAGSGRKKKAKKKSTKKKTKKKTTKRAAPKRKPAKKKAKKLTAAQKLARKRAAAVRKAKRTRMAVKASACRVGRSGRVAQGKKPGRCPPKPKLKKGKVGAPMAGRMHRSQGHKTTQKTSELVRNFYNLKEDLD